jgi:hypothetical protein
VGDGGVLKRLLLAEPDECPLSDVFLWARVRPFVHWREQQRRFLAGMDPVTGETDQYADMMFDREPTHAGRPSHVEPRTLVA